MAIINGDGQDDFLIGTADDDVISGLGGNDVLNGLAGDDQLFGGDGDDTLQGDEGDDSLFGQLGVNLIFGGAGEDFIDIANGSDDTVNGGADFDTISFGQITQGLDFNINTGQWTVDTFGFDGSAGFRLTDVSNVESVLGSNNNDQFTVAADFIADDGNFINIRGRDGDDRIEALGALGQVVVRADYRGAAAGVVADLEAGTARSAQPNDLAQVGIDTLIQVTQLRGSGFGDQLFGSNNDVFESFRGDAGNDFIDGRDGTDRLDYRSSVAGVTVDMTAGVTTNDGFGFFDVFANMENVRGSSFVDSLTGDSGSNFFQPRGGDDVVDGRGGVDIVDYSNEVAAGVGINAILGVTSSITSTAPVASDEIGTDVLISIEGVRGTAADDIFVAENGFEGSFLSFNFFEGLGGNDSITGNNVTRVEYDKGATAGIHGDLRAGIIRGDASIGRDTVSGIFEIRATAFNDRLFGSDITPIEPDGDTLFESFEGLAGDDLIVGRGGLDRVNYSQSIGSVNVNLATGLGQDGFGTTDTLFGIEGIKGSIFNDVLTGDSGDNFFQSIGGKDVIDGADGIDEIDFENLNTSLSIDLRLDKATHANGDVVTLLNIENATGGEAGDSIVGTGGANVLDGEGGDDRLVGLAGDDELIGGLGNDVLFGNSGADILEGEEGNDRLIGGFGDDVMEGGRGNDSYVVDSAGDEVNEFANGGLDIDSVFSSVTFTLSVAVEHLSLVGGNAIDGTGNGLDNAITGNEAVNVLRGGAGEDILAGGGGDDILIGHGDDDELDGGDGDDILRGGGGANDFIGGRGDDLITGGTDIGGVDIYEFAPGDGSDVVENFEVGVDFLDLTAFLFGDQSAASSFFSRVGANVRFSFNESSEFTLVGVDQIPFGELIV